MILSMSTSKCKINVGGKYFLLFYEGFLSVTLLQKHVKACVFWLVSLISSHMLFFVIFPYCLYVKNTIPLFIYYFTSYNLYKYKAYSNII